MNRLTNGCPCGMPCAESMINAPLMAAGEAFRFRRGDVLWSQGATADWVTVICSGTVKLSRRWPGEREPILILAHRGQILGEEAALAESQRVATVTAMTPGKALRVSSEDLGRLLKRSPKLYERLLGLSCQRLAAITERLEELGQGSVEERLARVLLRVGHEVGLRDARGIFLPLRLTRGDLADLVGCRVETIIRVMTRWQREGVVETLREGLVIKHPHELEQVAVHAAAA